MLPVKDSAAESTWLRETLINPILRYLGLTEVNDHVVRKAAHVAEFLLLSVFATLHLRGKAARALMVCFTVAFLDETIQLISDRGAQVQDVWIDLIGIATGSFLGWLITQKRKDYGEKSAKRQE